MSFFRYFICVSPRTRQQLLLTVTNVVHEYKNEINNNIKTKLIIISSSNTKSFMFIQNVPLTKY